MKYSTKSPDYLKERGVTNPSINLNPSEVKEIHCSNCQTPVVCKSFGSCLVPSNGKKETTPECSSNKENTHGF